MVKQLRSIAHVWIAVGTQAATATSAMQRTVTLKATGLIGSIHPGAVSAAGSMTCATSAVTHLGPHHLHMGAVTHVGRAMGTQEVEHGQFHTPDSKRFGVERLCMAAAMAEEEVGQAQLTKCWWGEGRGGSSADKCYKQNASQNAQQKA